jgi:hypothetical protein
MAKKASRRKPADDSITEFVIDQLRSLGPVEARSMFGGKGLYWREMIFGLVDDGRVYFGVGAATVDRDREKGSKPFEPSPDPAREPGPFEAEHSGLVLAHRSLTSQPGMGTTVTASVSAQDEGAPQP